MLKTSKQIFSLFQNNKSLILELTKREIRDKYVGNAFGLFWSIGHPLLLMGIYVVIFTFVFPSRFPEELSITRDYTAFILSGLIPWLTFQDSLSRASTVITQNSNLVKQIVFPIEILPVKSVLSAMPSQVVSTLILLSYEVMIIGSVPLSFLFVPVLMLVQILYMLALSYLLGGLGVYVRDLKDVVTVFNSANLFMMPIIFVPGVIPKSLEFVFYLNPFSYMIWVYQDVTFYGEMMHPIAWIVFFGFSFLALLGSFSVFSRVKHAFGDLL